MKKRIRKNPPQYLTCQFCGGPLPEKRRSDTMYCLTKCRVNAYLTRKYGTK